MPIIRDARIEHPPTNYNFKTSDFQPRSNSDNSISQYVIPIIIAIAAPLGIILSLTIYRLILHRLTANGTPKNCTTKPPPRKLRKRRDRERRRSTIRSPNIDVHYGDNEDDHDREHTSDDINLSLLSSRQPSVIGSEGVITIPASAVSETFPLMRGSMATESINSVSMDSLLLRSEISSRTQMEELEERVRRLEGRLTVAVPLEAEGGDNQLSRERVQDPMSPDEPLPAYTSRPASTSFVVVPRVVSTSSGWNMVG